MHIGDMLIAGQGVADQDGIRAFRVEFAIGLVGDLEWSQIDAAIKRQRLIRAEQGEFGTRMVRLLRPLVGVDRGTSDRLYFHHLATDLLSYLLPNQAKKNRPEQRFGRDHFCPRPV